MFFVSICHVQSPFHTTHHLTPLLFRRKTLFICLKRVRGEEEIKQVAPSSSYGPQGTCIYMIVLEINPGQEIQNRLYDDLVYNTLFPKHEH